MTKVWYLAGQDGKVGPLARDEIQDMLRTLPDPARILVWRDGFPAWMRAGDVPELQDASAGPPPVPQLPRQASGAPAKWRWGFSGVGICLVLATISYLLDDEARPAGSDASLAYYAGYFLGTSGIGFVIGFLAGCVRDLWRPWNARAGAPQPSAAKPMPPARGGNFIARHWRGEFALATSYWLFGLLCTFAVAAFAVTAKWAFSVDAGYNPSAILVCMTLIWSFVVAVGIWQLVGVWRSANRRVEERSRLGKSAPWAVVAKAAALIGALGLATEVAKSGVPQLTELYRIAVFDDPGIPPYAMRVMRDGTEAEITGGFKYGLTSDFIKLLDASPQIKVIHLNSGGGRIGEAEALRKVIAERRLTTYTSAHCLSACTLAFAGGAERWIRNGAVLGFHAPAFPGSGPAAVSGSVKMQQDAFTNAGIDEAFSNRALATPNAEMWRPSIDELTRAKFVTAVSQGNEFAASGFGSDLTRSAMEQRFARMLPLLQTMQETFPADHTRVIDALLAAYTSGQTDNEMVKRARSFLFPFIVQKRPLADDDVIVSLATLYADQYAALGRKDPVLCYGYASGTADDRNLAAELPKDLVDRESALYQRVLLTAAPRPGISEDATTPLWEKVAQRMGGRETALAKFALLENTSVAPAAYKDYCAASVDLFAAIVGLPQAEAATLLRTILATP